MKDVNKMTNEKAINAYNLVCRINELEKFVEALKDADKVSIKIDNSDKHGTNLALTLYSGIALFAGDIDDIKEILAVFEKKLESLKKQLEEM